MFHLTLIGFCLLLGTFSTGKRMRNRGSKSEECGTTHDDKCWYSNGTVGGVRNGFSWVPALYWLLDLGLCHQNSRRNVPGKQHPQLAFQSILAMFLRWSSWLGEKNKLLDSPSFLESPILCDLLYSTQTGSRCLNCLRNFVKASKSSPPSVWCLLQLNVLKNVYNTCQQQQMSC